MSWPDSIPEDESGGASNKLIQKMQYLTIDVDEQMSRLEQIEERTDQVIGNQGEILRAIARLQKCVDGLQRQTAKKKPKHESRHPPSRKKAASQTTAAERSNLNLLPLALRYNIVNFLDKLTFSASLIPDQLITAECLSEDECEFIRSKQNRKDQIRLVIRKIMRRGPETIKQFLDIVKEDQSHLVDSVYATLNTLAASKQQINGCTICLMRKHVDLKDIADIMWKEKIIDDDTYDDITERDTIEKQFLWNKVVDVINMSDARESAISILTKALHPKYKYIAQDLEKCTELFCSCRRRKRAQRRMGGVSSNSSQTDLSTSSNVPRFENIDESDSEQSVHSWTRDRQLISFERGHLIKTYDNDPCDSTTDGDPVTLPKSPNLEPLTGYEQANSDRTRNRSGKFQQNETHAELDDQHLSLPLLQQYFLDSSQDVVNANDHSAIRRSNNVMVAAAQSSTPGDEEEPMSTDDTISHRASFSTDTTTPSPDVKGNNTGMFAVPVFSPESASDCHNDESANEKSANDNRRKVHRRVRRLSARHPEEGTYADDDEEDNDDDSKLAALKRTRHKTHRTKFLKRQASAPAGTKVTESRTKFPQTEHDLDKGAMRGSKSSRKRAERRASKPGEASEAVESSRNTIPYNPTWTTQTQSRNTCKWDYYQARRYTLMAQTLYPDQPTRHAKSDTDFRTDGSDTVVLSDYTV